jgi:hypothetical protein
VTSAVADARDGEAVEHAGRFGLSARGVIYLLIAFIATQMALGTNDQPAERKGALRSLADHPLGRLALIVLTCGFAAYALWRFAEAAGRKDGVGKRIAAAGKGALYASAALTAASTFIDSGAGGKDSNEQSRTWTAEVLGWPAGRALVATGGFVAIGVGCYLVWRGVTRKFEKRMKLVEMSPRVHTVVKVVGTVGHTARGVVVGLLGALLVRSALHRDANEAQGIDGTLRTIAAQPYGRLLLLLTAAGLAAYGVHSFLEARYRRT